jgi:hypothetical protein
VGRPGTFECLGQLSYNVVNSCLVVRKHTTGSSPRASLGARHGLVDQLEDRLVCNQEAVGSNPTESTMDSCPHASESAPLETPVVWERLGTPATGD